MIRLILGGEKSGKSNLAWELFRAGEGPGVVLAMGLARDMAFRRQILAHRQARDPSVPVVEPGLALPGALNDAASAGRNVLVDSLDFWLFACMEAGLDLAEELETSLQRFAGEGLDAVLVSCEVGLGPVAATSMVRRFTRRMGALNQRLASLSEDARLVVAGIPIRLK